MKSKLLLLISIIMISLSFFGAVGCTNGDKQPGGPNTPFIGGITGVLVGYMNEAPPAEVYDGGTYPFDIVVELKNDGEWTIKKGELMVKILGVDPADFGKTPSDLVRVMDVDLVGSSKQPDTGVVTKGDVTSLEFTSLNYKGKTAGNMQMPISASVCYTYGTDVTSQLCIKQDPTDASTKICKIEEDKLVYSSTAPVQVTKLHESWRGSKMVSFSFTIQKKGTGIIFEKGSKCNTEGIRYDNKVWVEVIVPELGQTKCTGIQGGTDNMGYAILYNNERTITCTQPVSTELDYVKNIQIRLIYDYREDLVKTILIKHARE